MFKMHELFTAKFSSKFPPNDAFKANKFQNKLIKIILASTA